MQTILGANGVIGRALSRALYSDADRIRQVSRAPKRMDPTDDLVSADLLDAKATADAVAGSSVAISSRASNTTLAFGRNSGQR
jgi:nucleoside-diphosphate-sugar epimerase